MRCGIPREPNRQIPVTRADNRVLVAGAGPVGLVLALCLARRGHRVVVVEKLVDLLDQV
ncbi:MAG: FAD-binding protein, partial [Acidimicrobiaceae bacterium]|nr:FAD-binding protein [Acidimicrobiaceae bacterium]